MLHIVVNVEGALITASFPSLVIGFDVSSWKDIQNFQGTLHFGIVILRNLEGISDERLHLPEFAQSKNRTISHTHSHQTEPRQCVPKALEVKNEKGPFDFLARFATCSWKDLSWQLNRFTFSCRFEMCLCVSEPSPIQHSQWVFANVAGVCNGYTVCLGPHFQRFECSRACLAEKFDET